MKMVHLNTVFIREEAKQIRDTHWYGKLHLKHSVHFPAQSKTTGKQEKVCSHDHNVTIGGVTCGSYRDIGHVRIHVVAIEIQDMSCGS